MAEIHNFWNLLLPILHNKLIDFGQIVYIVSVGLPFQLN